MQTTPLFPSLIYSKFLNLDLDKIANDILAWSEQSEGIQRTNVNGWHSETDMHTRDEFQPIVAALQSMLEDIFEEEQIAGPPILGNMWANINYSGGYNRPHIHPNCLFSGAFYIKVPEKSGNIVFNDPRPARLMAYPIHNVETPKSNLWRDVHIKPRENIAIVFPAWLSHHVETNTSNETRISISFNFIQELK